MKLADRPEVWLVSELYYPEETSTGYFVSGIAEGLATEYRTAVLCSQPTYAARGVKAPRHELRNGVEIFRLRNTRLDNRVLTYRMLNALTIAWAVFLSVLLRVRKGNTVIVVTNPPIVPLVTRIAALLRGARCILLVHDVYPDAAVAANIIKRGGLLHRIATRVFKHVYSGFDRVVVLGRDMRDLIIRKIVARPDVVQIIPNWGEAPAAQEREPGYRSRLGLEDKFVVQYSGNIGRTHSIQALLRAAEQLRDDPRIHFVIIGSGSLRPMVEEAVKSGRAPNVTLLRAVPRAEAAVVLAEVCDVSLISLVSGMTGVSVPSRLYNVLAAGKPVIGAMAADSEVALVIAEERIGWVVPPDDADALVAAILAARDNPAERSAMSTRARAAGLNKYTRSNVVRQWLELVRGLHSNEERTSLRTA